MKKIICILLSLFVTVSALAGCKSGEKTTQKRSTVKKDDFNKESEVEKSDDYNDYAEEADDDDDEPKRDKDMKEYKDDKEDDGYREYEEKKEEEQEEQDEEDDGEEERNRLKAENADKRTISGVLKNFTATTLDGRRFSSADIAKYDVTVINFWGTYCGPCIAEMPDLAEFYDNLPAGVNFVTYCVDGSGNEDEAQSIIDDAGLDAIVILGASGDFADILGQIMYIPTTIFVNKYGEIVSYEMIGRSADLLKDYKEHIKDALAETGR